MAVCRWFWGFAVSIFPSLPSRLSSPVISTAGRDLESVVRKGRGQDLSGFAVRDDR
jgi:hypothetical protein